MGKPLPTDDAARAALLAAYRESMLAYGSKWYHPIAGLRRRIQRLLRLAGFRVSRRTADRILVDAERLLGPEFRVTYAPFSGPAVGGVSVPDAYSGRVYAGFLSLHPPPQLP